MLFFSCRTGRHGFNVSLSLFFSCRAGRHGFNVSFLLFSSCRAGRHGFNVSLSLFSSCRAGRHGFNVSLSLFFSCRAGETWLECFYLAIFQLQGRGDMACYFSAAGQGRHGFNVSLAIFQLQGGGDMGLLTNFNTAAVRQGFIIDNVSHTHMLIRLLSMLYPAHKCRKFFKNPAILTFDLEKKQTSSFFLMKCTYLVWATYAT